jgi:hypothetical protein
MWIWLLVACGPPVHRHALRDISDDLSELGHPFGKYQDIEIVDWKRGKAEAGKRYVDVAVRYTRGLRPYDNTMLVRIYRESVEPCRISVDVLSDDGPNPWTLDNKLASRLMGNELCALVAQR